MITTKQKWILGALVPLGAAIWAPQLTERFGAETSASIEEDSDLELEIYESSGGMGIDASPMGTGTSSAQGSAPAPSSGNLEGPDATLAAILQTLQGTEAFGGTRGPAPNGGIGALARDVVASEAEGDETAESFFESSPMLTFVEENALRGTLSGAVTRYALFGNFRIAEGELIPGTAARVVSVGRGQVTLEESGIELEVKLPPLETDPSRAVAASASNSNSNSTSNSGTGGVSEDPVLPEVNPVTPPTGGTNQ